jgi:membrane fusion protein (multidrug efflux system)
MKKIIALLSIIILSCNEKEQPLKSVVELNSEKARLILQIDSLSNALKQVEFQLTELDTTKRLTAVTAYKAVEKKFNHFIQVQGVVEADQSVELYPERNGNITEIYVKEGQRVSKGQTLAEIDNSILKSSMAELQTQLDLAKTTFERQERLWGQNIGSELQFLQAKAKKEGLENSLNSLKSQAQKLKIIAPFSGTVDEIFIKTGGLATPQMPALRLVNLDKIHIECDVTETYLKSIKQGTEVAVYFSSIDKNFTSKISQVGNFINPNNRSFKARIDLDNLSSELKANMLADVKINDFSANGVVIPTTLIQKDRKGDSFVFSLEKTGNTYSVKKSFVTQASTYNNFTYISEGLMPNSLLVDKGARLVKANEKVIVSE